MKHLLPAVQRTALRIPWAAVGGCAAALLLTAAAPGGQYAPWALAAVAAVGVGWQGLLAVVCAGLGALLFMDFQPGLRHTAAALLIFCANTALCNTRLYRRPRFRPIAAVCAAGLTQLPYLIQRGGRQWALCMASLALLYGAAALLPDLLPESAAEQADKRRAWFLLLLGVCAVPAGWTVMGFSPAVVLAGILLLYFVGIENYRTIFANKAFRLAAGNTLRFFGVCVPLLVVLSLIIAVLLAGQKRFTQILKSFFLLPMAIPVASVVLLWRLLFDDQGLLNHLLHMLSVQTTDWMNTGASFYVLVISYIWRNLGYDVVLWMAGLSAIPAALYEAAKVDGAGEWKCFTKITLPNLLPSLFTIVVLSVLNAFKVFREAYLVAGDYPQEKMYLLQHLFNNWYRDLSLDKMSAAAVVTGLVIFLLILGLWKAWGKGGAE